MSLAVAFISLIFGALLIAAVYAALLSRHKKAATGRLELMNVPALVETALEPEGSVLVDGELWRARARGGLTIKRGTRVLVVGTSGHLLEVEPAPKVLPSMTEA
ncbi:MAG TPA: NfeD family protein [Pyrinomonadaceae bacterium]|jgi:membrane-bound serine protease (ClpP class)